MIKSVKGTQDILDVQLTNFLLTSLRDHIIPYQFTEIKLPVLEHTALFERSVGQETDIVSKEMYFVRSIHEPESTELCLRPEITAPIMRAFLEHGIQTTPWKVFTYGQCFRHERPQKGRYREFYQVSLEIIGSTSPYSDAYFVTMLDRFFHEKLHLTTYALMINFLGCPEDRKKFRAKLLTFLVKNSEKICSTCNERKDRNVLRVLDCKTPECQTLYAQAPAITDCLCQDCSQEWDLIQKTLHQLSVAYTLAPHLVRGLDYYNKLVFEFVSVDSSLGAQNTFCGGGRYDSLAKQLGSKSDYPSIGAGIGIDRTLLMLEAIKDILPLPQHPALHLILPMGINESAFALQIADTLHAHNIATDILFEGSIKSMMRKADKLAAASCIIIGADELVGHYLTVKNMKTGTEEKVHQMDLLEHLRTLL